MSWRPVMTSNLREMTKAYNRPLSTTSSATDAQRHLHGALARTCKNDRNGEEVWKSRCRFWLAFSSRKREKQTEQCAGYEVNACECVWFFDASGPLRSLVGSPLPTSGPKPFTFHRCRFDRIWVDSKAGAHRGFRVFWHDEIICIYNVNVYLLVVSMCSLHFSHMMMFLSIILSCHGRGRSLRDAFRIFIVAVSTFYVTRDEFDIHKRM